MGIDDKTILTDCLLDQKQSAAMYKSTCDHTDDPQFLQTLQQICAEEENMRLEIYKAMHERGWYNPQMIDSRQLQEAQQKARQKQQDLGMMLRQTSTPHSTGGYQPQTTTYGATNYGVQQWNR